MKDLELQTCETFSEEDGSWVMSHFLQNRRVGHQSWNSSMGVLLIGGLMTDHDNEIDEDQYIMTTELLDNNGGSKFWFNLTQPSYLSCLIDEGDTFLLTGGFGSPNMASRYDINGWVEDIDPLLTPRFFHSCFSYVNDHGERVNLVCSQHSWYHDDNTVENCEENISGTKTWREIPIGNQPSMGSSISMDKAHLYLIGETHRT